MMYTISVRQKSKDLVDFIQDDDRLRDERKKAKKNKDKYIGMSGMESSSRFSYSEFTLNPSPCHKVFIYVVYKLGFCTSYNLYKMLYKL